jgi:hypothetical protein
MRIKSLLPLVLPLGVQAQGVVEQTMQTTQNLTSLLGGNINVAFSGHEDASLGSPMLLTGWRPGKVLLAGNKEFIGVPLRYDIYRQELRVRRPQGDSVLLDLTRVREFQLGEGSITRRFINYPLAPPETTTTCAEVLVEALQVQLLKYWRKVVVKQAAVNESYGAYTMVSVLQPQVRYYLHWSSANQFVPLKLKRASLEQALVSYGPALTALKARKGSLSTEADSVSALTELEPLLAASAR